MIVHKDWTNCVQPTVDGGYVIAGVIRGMGDMHSAIYLVKIDTHGGKLWCKAFGQGDVNRGNSVPKHYGGGLTSVGGRIKTSGLDRVTLNV